MKYLEANKKAREWMKSHSYKEIRNVARPNKYPWHFWSAKWSTWTAVLFLKLRFTPNFVTFLWFLTGIASSFFLWPGNFTCTIIFFLIYNFTWYLDFVDGDMARILSHSVPKFKQNITASWLDKFAYSTHKSFALFGAGVGAYGLSGNFLFAIFGFVSAYLLMWDNLMKTRAIEIIFKKGKAKEMSNNPLRYMGDEGFIPKYITPLIRPEPISFFSIFLLLGFFEEVTIIYLCLYALFIFFSFIKIYSKLSKIYR